MVINHGLKYFDTGRDCGNDHLAKDCPIKPAETKNTILGIMGEIPHYGNFEIKWFRVIWEFSTYCGKI